MKKSSIVCTLKKEDVVKFPYGLSPNQMRTNEEKIISNASWHNRDCTQEEFGDLNGEDFLSVAKNMPNGDVFFLIRDDIDGAPNDLKMKKEYVARRVTHIITPKNVFVVDDELPENLVHEVCGYEKTGGLRFTIMSRENAMKMVLCDD